MSIRSAGRWCWPGIAAVAILLALPGIAAAAAPERLTLPRTASKLAPEIFPVKNLDTLPEGFVLTARRALRIANSQPEIGSLRAKHPEARPIVYLSPLTLAPGTFWHWTVRYEKQGELLAEVEIGPNAVVYQVTTGVDVGWPLVRGYDGVLGGKLNRPYLWLPLCLLFIAPFFDPRRPFRLLHLDLLVLLGFGVSHYFFNRGEPGTSVPLVYPVLAYLVVRLLLAVYRPVRRAGALVPVMRTPVLAGLLLILVLLRAGFTIWDSQTTDVSFAGVVGADRIVHGQELYTDNEFHADTYGPVNYLTYIPFEALFPYEPDTNDLPAAKAASLAFDLLAMLALYLLGSRLSRDGPRSRTGLALALAWAAYPYTALTLASTTNDVIVPLFVLFALLAVTSAGARGALTALGALAKFAPGVLVPALAAGTRRLRLRDALIFGAAFLAVAAILVIPLLPDGGFREFWNTTLGFQLGRSSPLALWDREPSLAWLQTLLKIALAALAVAAAFVPRRRSVTQLAALCGALLALSQMTADYWIYFYAVWLLPFAMLAFAGEHREQARS